ncbi:MAG: hypothetical protein WA484_16025 [Solirubrobacteraceae bacterium]
MSDALARLARRAVMGEGGHGRCDFCLPTEVATVAYPIRPIVGERTPRPQWWLACDVCAALVAATRRDELAQRALQLRSGAGLGLRADAPHLEFIRKTHDRFWSARDGEPESLEGLT